MTTTIDDLTRKNRRTRRVAAGVLALAGVINLVSAVTPPLRGRLDLLRDVVPIGVERTASALVAVAGLALLLLSRGVRRGQRHAWALAVAVASASALLHMVKGLDAEEALVALATVAYLMWGRRAFRVSADRDSLARALTTLAFGGGAAVVAGTISALWLPRPSHMSVVTAFSAVGERLVGLRGIAIPGRRDHWLSPSLEGVGFALAVFAAWLLFSPLIGRRARDLQRAREIVQAHGSDTLAYFALRDDKEHWFWRDTLIAFAVHHGVCLVSPDPIGPPDQRIAAWQAFRAFADAHGWTVAVMGAAEEWRSVYRETGMRDLYIGDEAIVDVRTFALDGGRKKGLRQAVNRVANHGYTIEFHDPAAISPELEHKLRALMCESRRGAVERGFSMTLGRVFSPDDRGLLLAVCFGPDGEPAAFCHYVPSSDIDGYSLDLMRRSEREGHPNGLTDFVVVRTIEFLREIGLRGLGLNFAVMRAVLADERNDRVSQRVERRVLGWLSESMQIESLWRYNAKFDPDWRPRYAVYDAAENFLPSAVAVARAESFAELPVIGRLFESQRS